MKEWFTRARLAGLAILVVTFALGVFSGRALSGRVPEGVVMTLTTTDEMPGELERLALSDDQRRRIQEILRAGRPRVMQVLDEMQPRMRAVIEGTEAEIARVLTPDQAERWREERALNPPRFERRVIER